MCLIVIYNEYNHVMDNEDDIEYNVINMVENLGDNMAIEIDNEDDNVVVTISRFRGW